MTMKTKSIYSLCVVAVLSLLFAVGASAQEKKPEAQDKKPEIKVSEEEMKALNAINALTDPAAKLNAMADFVKKFPKTLVRMQLADNIAGDIAKVKDPAQAISLGET